MSRSDDVITSAGYRIGPGEIEDCILRHPAVAMVGVVGVPDPVRTEAIKAWVVLKPGQLGSDALAAEIQDHVRTAFPGTNIPATFLHRCAAHDGDGKILRRELRRLG